MAMIPHVVGALVLLVAAALPAAAQDTAAALRAAATRGDVAEVRRAIEMRSPLDGKDARGQTALLLSVDAGHTEVAAALIAAGADINAVAANQDTP